MTELIEEAAKAIYALDPDRQAWDGDAYGFLEPGAERGRKRAIAQAGSALAVFDKAHTPTDDEREALADRLARRLINDPKQLMLAEGTGALHVALSESIRSVIEDVYADCGDSDSGVLSSNIARRLACDLPPAIIADAALRRSEVPEPSRDPGWSHPEAVYSPEVFMAIQGLLSEARGEPMHALRLAVSRQLSELQGEPSDAQVEALVDAAMSVAPEPFNTWRYRMTTALRAAGGVR